MTLADVVEAVRKSTSDTVVARAFRLAAGVPWVSGRGKVSARGKGRRFDGMAECFENRRRVVL